VHITSLEIRDTSKAGCWEGKRGEAWWDEMYLSSYPPETRTMMMWRLFPSSFSFLFSYFIFQFPFKDTRNVCFLSFFSFISLHVYVFSSFAFNPSFLLYIQSLLLLFASPFFPLFLLDSPFHSLSIVIYSFAYLFLPCYVRILPSLWLFTVGCLQVRVLSLVIVCIEITST